MSKISVRTFASCLSLVALVALGAQGCASSGQASARRQLGDQLQFNRSVTDRLLARIKKNGRADQALRYTAQRGRAPVGWHLMHLAGTEDRFAAMFSGGKVLSPKYTKLYSSRGRDGKRSKATSTVPPYKDVAAYLKATRTALLKSLAQFDYARLDEKAPGGRFTYRFAIQILLYHEPHHQGQAQAMYNIMRRGR